MPLTDLPSASSKDGANSSKSRKRGKEDLDIYDDDNNNKSNNSNSKTGDTMHMPKANVAHIMRKTLPTHARISDEAKETVQKCASSFINFITKGAIEHSHREKRKTITGEDLLWSLGNHGFEDYVAPLALYLQRYREVEGTRGSLGSSFLPYIKPTAPRAGIYQQQQVPHSHNLNPVAPGIPHRYPFPQQSPAFLSGGGGSIVAAKEEGLPPAQAPTGMSYRRLEAPAYGQPPAASYAGLMLYWPEIVPRPSMEDEHRDMGESSSSQAEDSSEELHFPTFHPYAPK
ncbi:hypothetical protein Taro_055460, partial [Colocasia esculenta]|nr:hypothetical protein [Colocasia esculenta]